MHNNPLKPTVYACHVLCGKKQIPVPRYGGLVPPSMHYKNHPKSERYVYSEVMPNIEYEREHFMYVNTNAG